VVKEERKEKVDTKAVALVDTTVVAALAATVGLEVKVEKEEKEQRVDSTLDLCRFYFFFIVLRNCVCSYICM